MNWSIGITTCKRNNNFTKNLIKKIKMNGWDKISLYAEPDSEVDNSVRVINRDMVYGCWTNWICSLYDMYSIDIEADYYCIFEDDIEICLGVKNYLENLLPSIERFGAISLYTPSNQSRKSLGLNCIHDNSFMAESVWGTQAIVFSKESLCRFLSSRNVFDHRRIGYGVNNKNRDTALGIWASKQGEKLFYHNPSLVQHIGKESSINHEYHYSSNFVGENYDATLLIDKKIPIIVNPIKIHII